MNHSLEEKFFHPPPDSALAAARDFGIDLTLLANRLKLTPEERLNNLQQAMSDIETARKQAREQIAEKK